MRIPHSIQGTLFAPALIALLFLLKGLCPASAGNACFADYFATPVFLPLIAIYKMFGYAPQASYAELGFIFLYWALIGFLLGYAADLLSHKEVAPAGVDTVPAKHFISAVMAPPVPVAPRPTVVPPAMKTPPPPSAPAAPVVKAAPAIPGQKPPINLLDRAEYK